jgi:hypothetical protein
LELSVLVVVNLLSMNVHGGLSGGHFARWTEGWREETAQTSIRDRSEEEMREAAELIDD